MIQRLAPEALVAGTAGGAAVSTAGGRDAPERRASEILPRDLVQGVALLAKVPEASLTTQQCWFTIARSGGYLRRRSGGPPGWKTLWKGWFYIQTLLEGVHLATRLSLD